jgi:uncharacterized protein (UPF0332 family)
VTDDQKNAAIAAETARGAEALEEADLLFSAKKLPGAISRAYYATFHYARALLLLIDVEPKTHGGLVRLLQANFVRSGKLPPEIAASFSKLMSLRQDADYTAEYVFTEDMVRSEIETARHFVAAAAAILAAGSR